MISLKKNKLNDQLIFIKQTEHDRCHIINSAIHKAAGSLVTGCSQKYQQQERPLEAVSPLTASRLEQWNDGIVPGKSWNGREP